MKILHITDSHGTVKSPESRKDIYYVSFLKKLYEIGYVVKKHNIDMVIHTGDLFHSARVSDKFAGQVANLINAFGVPMYVVPGNHDIEGYTIDTIDQTKLGLLAKTNTVTLLERDRPLRIIAKQGNEEFTVAISGQEYYANIDEGNPSDYDMQQDEADLNILAIHGYVTPVAQHPSIKCTMANTITTDADIILAGHYHQQFEYNGPDFDIYNPGSLMRVDQTQYNKSNVPKYGILDIVLNDKDEIIYSYSFHELKSAQPSTTVFDYNAKYAQTAANISLENFKNSISSSLSTTSLTTNILDIIDNICMSGQVDASIKALAVDAYNEALQLVPDEFNAQPGYIESHHTKKIKTLELINFQSHEHTVIDFNEGLNIFVGESNSGKTTIFRAILWVIDNQPLGTDFIMAGKNDCSVQITYTDGTYIKRSRTLKDTGSYDIAFLDENNKLKTQTYKGFTNAVPVEVANVHQMPKVDITKDLQTHLNVITQLEGPFLLTESPMVKAAAIGRITGTHVIDRGIKEKSSTILSNKKLIKSYTKDKEEKENILKTLPDVDAMQLFFDSYQQIFDYIKNLDTYITEVNTLQVFIGNITQEAQVQQNRINQLKAVAGLKPIIEEVITKLNLLTNVKHSYQAYCNCINDINLQQQQLDIDKVIASAKDLVNSAITRNRDYQKIRNTYLDYVSTTQTIKETEQLIQLHNSYQNIMKSIVLRCQSLRDYINHAKPMIERIAFIDMQEKTTNRDISDLKQWAEDVKKSIYKTQQERDQFILDNHICPCCGQEINDTHTKAITEFMKQ